MAGEAANTPRLIGSPAFRVWRENFGWAKDKAIGAKNRQGVNGQPQDEHKASTAEASSHREESCSTGRMAFGDYGVQLRALF